MSSKSMMLDLSDEQLEQVVGGHHHRQHDIFLTKIINEQFIVVTNSNYVQIATGGVVTGTNSANGASGSGSSGSSSSSAGGIIIG